MRYVCLVYHDESLLDAMSPAEAKECTDESIAYDRTLEKSGNMVLAHALKPVKVARSVRMRAGKPLITDGPFAETREQLVGFILIEAAGDDEAMAIAAKIPLARTGIVEVRPVMGIGD